MRNWLKLVFCFLMIWGFMQLMPTILNKIPAYLEVIKNSESLKIDNSSLFYSEEPLTSIAEIELNDRLISVKE